jgi:biotin carboxyl carrier protein
LEDEMKKFNVKVNGTQYEVEIEEVNDGSKAVAAPSPAVSAPVAAPAATAAAAPQVTRPAAATAAAGTISVTSPMPGTILKLRVAQGDAVKKGQTLLILEAMKMENEIVSPKDATVASVNVTKGASVNAGDLLVTLS